MALQNPRPGGQRGAATPAWSLSTSHVETDVSLLLLIPSYSRRWRKGGGREGGVGDGRESGLLVDWLLNVPATGRVYLKDGSAQAECISRTDLPRQSVSQGRICPRQSVSQGRICPRQSVSQGRICPGRVYLRDGFAPGRVYLKDGSAPGRVYLKDGSAQAECISGTDLPQAECISRTDLPQAECTFCHTGVEVANQTFFLIQSQYTDTGPTSPSADPVTPGAWQGNHRSAIFSKSLV